MEIKRKLEDIEKGIEDLKILLLFKDDVLYEKKLVSLQGMGKILVTEKEMEIAIKEAKTSIFHSVQNDLFH
jgi:hypothetical protein